MISKFKIFEAKFPEDDMTMNQLLKRRVEIPKELEILRHEAADIRRRYDEKLAEHGEKYKERNRVEQRITWAVKKDYKVGQKISITDFYQYGGYRDRPATREIFGLGKILSDDLEITKINPKSVIIKYRKLVNKNIPLNNNELRTAARGYGRISFRDDDGNYTRFVVPQDQRRGKNKYDNRNWTPTHKKGEVSEEVELRVPKKFINAIFYKKSIDAQKEMTKRAVTSLNEKIDDGSTMRDLLQRQRDVPTELSELYDQYFKLKGEIKAKEEERRRINVKVPQAVKKKYKVGDKISITDFRENRFTPHLPKNREIRGFGKITSDELEIMNVTPKTLILKFKKLVDTEVPLSQSNRQKLANLRRNAWSNTYIYDNSGEYVKLVIPDEHKSGRGTYNSENFTPTHKIILTEREVQIRVHQKFMNAIFYKKVKDKEKETTRNAVQIMNEVNYPEDDMNAAQLLNREQDIPEELRELRKLILDSQEALRAKNRELGRVRTRIHKRLNKKFKVGDKIDISGFRSYNHRGYIQRYVPGFYGITSDNIEITKVNKRSLYVKYTRISGQKDIPLTKAEQDLYRRDRQAAQQQFHAVIDHQQERRNNRMRLIGGKGYAPTHKRVLVEEEIIEKVHIDKINKIIYTEIKKNKAEMVKKTIHDIND